MEKKEKKYWLLTTTNILGMISTLAIGYLIKANEQQELTSTTIIWAWAITLLIIIMTSCYFTEKYLSGD